MITSVEAEVYASIFKNGGDTSEAVLRTVQEAVSLGKVDPDNSVFFYETNRPNGFMCNFYKSPQWADGICYPTNEHYYQAQKATDPQMKMWIAQCPKPFHAMQAGHALREKKGEIRRDWDEVKYGIMLTGLRCKFFQSLDLAIKLLATGDKTIHEASPVDMTWGVLGEDLLGKALMEVRKELQNPAIFALK
jgi:ribA/ribD-fused uncharacterized protein